ncbi:MAG: outer membrane beta-barrel protein [Rubrivivax sp.]
MKKLLALAAIGLVTSLPAAANTAGLVFGVDFGKTSVSGLDVDGNGFGLYGGYRFNESIAVEVGYRHLFKETVREFGVPVELKATSVQASVVGYLPLGNDFSLFGRLGYNELKAKAGASGRSATGDQSGTLYGIGAEYDVNKNVAIRFEFQKPASDTRVVLLGAKFSF